jgi:phosphatidylinositol alpha-1,6-mannosyltransferase
LLVIVGDGPLKGQLQAWVDDLGLSSQVLLVGAVPYQNLPSHYAASDVFVLSSAYEGNARVLAEAAASAKPVVCTDVSGARDTVLHGETGYIVPIGDDIALARLSGELLAAPDRARAMGRRARQHITTLYDPDSILKGFRSLWETTARGKPC